MARRNVVVNTSPLIYLAKIDELDLLRKIFDEIYVPLPVYEETQKKSEMEDAKKITSASFLLVKTLTEMENDMTRDIS